MMNVYTEKIIFWIDHHQYSRQHWDTVANEVLAEAGSMEDAIPRLGFAIRSFHIKFQDGVVKVGNVLYDLIDLAYMNVDWDAVAKHVYDTMQDHGPKE